MASKNMSSSLLIIGAVIVIALVAVAAIFLSGNKSLTSTSTIAATSVSNASSTISASTTAASTSTTTANATAVYSMPITLTNSQPTPIPAPFQQLLEIKSYVYSSYIFPDWSNIEFTTGPKGTGTKLQAWVEDNPSNTATQTAVWVNIPSGISGYGDTAIYMDFMKGSVMSQSGPTGEAPQLSASYGQHDNGAQVFPFYTNFAGTATPPGWTKFGSGVVQDNGVKVSFNSAIYTTSVFGPNKNLTLEMYGNIPVGVPNGPDPAAGYATVSSFPVARSPGGITWVTDTNYGTATAIGKAWSSNGLPQPQTSTTGVGTHAWTIYWPSSSGVYFSIDYNASAIVSLGIPATSLPIGLFNVESPSAPALGPFYWVRYRSYPPGGIMPSVSFGGVS